MQGTPTQLVHALLAAQRERDTGVLVVNAESVTTLAYFYGGKLVFAEEGTLGETLGRLLVGNGAITAEQYSRAVNVMSAQTVDSESPRMGEVLVQLGYVTVETVQRALISQVRRRVARLIEWERPAWDFDRGTDWLDGVPSYPMRVETCVLEGLRLFYDRPRMTALLAPYWDGHLMLRANVDLIAGCFGLTSAQARVVQTINGTRTTEGWLAEQGSDEAWGLVAALAMTGVLAVADSPPSTRSVQQASSGRRQLATLEAPPAYDPPEVRHGGAVPNASAPPVDGPAPDNASHERRVKLGAEKAFQKGLKLLKAERYAEAEGQFHEAVGALPRATEYHLYELWAASQSLPLLDAATVKTLEEAAITTAKQDSGHPFPPYILGHVAASKGDKATAARYFKVAYHRDPSNKEAAALMRQMAGDGRK
jgi:hypothetical protein